MTRSKLSNQARKGVTLVETLIFTAIAAVVLLVSGQILVSGLSTRSIIDAQQSLNINKRFISLSIQSRIENANAIIEPQVGIGSVLEFDSADASLYPVRIEWVEDDLIQTVGTGPAQQLNQDHVRVTGFEVTRLNGPPDAVRVRISYEVDTFSGATPSTSSETTYTIRYE